MSDDTTKVSITEVPDSSRQACQLRLLCGERRALAIWISGPSSRRNDAPLAYGVSTARHGTSAGWHTGCRCTHCRRAHSDTQRAYGRARAQKRLPVELRQQLLDAIYAGEPFPTTLRDLGLTANRVWGLARTDTEWSTALEAALMASRRDDLQHGTTAA